MLVRQTRKKRYKSSQALGKNLREILLKNRFPLKMSCSIFSRWSTNYNNRYMHYVCTHYALRNGDSNVRRPLVNWNVIILVTGCDLHSIRARCACTIRCEESLRGGEGLWDHDLWWRSRQSDLLVETRVQNDSIPFGLDFCPKPGPVDARVLRQNWRGHCLMAR